MIDVPVEVKDALREGTYKKNYRFKVFDLPSGGEYINVVTGWNGGGSEANGLTLSSPGKYKVYSSSPYFTLMFRSGTSYGGIMATDRDPVTGDFYVEHEFTYAPSTIWITYTSASYNVGVFTTYDYTIIDNNTLVSESVSIDERMCSGDTLKFGLCEGSSLEFQYFDKPNITGKRIQAFVDVDYGADEPYTIPMGFFDVKKCSRQASTGIIKATCYNKLQSDYLDQKANQTLINTLTTDGLVSMFDIRFFLLSDYKIIEDRTPVASWINPSGLTPISSTYADFGSFTFNKLYGVKSPINAKEFEITSTSTSFNIQNISHQIRYDLGVNCQIDARYGSLIALERLVVDYIKKLIDDSDLNRTGDEVIDYICTHRKFYNIIGVYIPNDGYYSTIQWEYEEAHEISHGNTKGKIADVQKLLRASATYYLITPKSISCFVDNLPDYPEIMYGGYINPKHYASRRAYYNYYVNDTLTTTASEDVPFLTFSDGTKYVYHIENVGYALLGYQYNNLTPADLIQRKPSEMPDFTLRELQSAVFETVCQFGQLSRITDLFSGVELNNGGLYPAEDLYPANGLYPSGASMSATKAMYSQLWADEGNVRKWRYLIITYKGLDGDNNEAEFTLQRTVNADGTDDYNMSDNWLFRNLIWTAEQVGDYADAMVAKMQDMTWFPFEMWCAGLPYLETGDKIEIPLNDVVYTSYVLQRQLKGIQNLQDTYINGTLDIY